MNRDGLYVAPGYYVAPVELIVSRWFGYVGCYTVCAAPKVDGFIDYAMKAVIDNFGNLVRVPS